MSKTFSSPIARINVLPDEIILRVFSLIIGVGNCTFETNVDAGQLPRHSLAISQVCSRWRLIAIGSQHLWSHIDLSSYFPLCGKLISRAKILASRAGTTPLSVHIIEQTSRTNYNCDEAADDLEEFFTDFGSRGGSLEIGFTSVFQYYYGGIISRCLESCTRGQFTRFTLKFRVGGKKIRSSGAYSSDSSSSQSDDDADSGLDGDSDTPSSSLDQPVIRDAFLYASDQVNRMSRYDSWRLNIPSSRLDEILFPVTVLKIDKMFPYWTSKVYHGLTDLRLVGWDSAKRSVKPKEEQLAEILKSSPGLRTFHFGLEIVPAAQPCSPVQLEELEALYVQSDSLRSQQVFLQLLLPGAKPLEMSIEHKSPKAVIPPSGTEDEFHKFIRRSNITNLFIDSRHDAELHLPASLQLLPNLCALTLRGIALDRIDTSFVLPTHSTGSRLHTLHILSSRIHQDAFSWTCDTNHPLPQRVTICRSSIGTNHNIKPILRDTHLSKQTFPRLEILEDTEHIDAFQAQDWDHVINARLSVPRF